MGELQFFPQYYRLILGFALDLAALGMEGVPLDEMASYIHRQELVQAETSDMHRAEALLMLERAGTSARDPGLEARLARFTAAASGFCLPNRRAAYELTHCVFHASNYGSKPLAPPYAPGQSLIHVGILAVMEDNLDLLAEVTIALRYAGQPVPAAWDQAIATAAGQTLFQPAGQDGPFDDDYHEYFVLNWALAMAGKPAFTGRVPRNTRLIRQAKRHAATLREVSLALLEMGEARLPDWGPMRWRLWPKLSQPVRNCLSELEQLPAFESFFAGFSRSAQRSHTGGVQP
jgi:hypothetical protein